MKKTAKVSFDLKSHVIMQAAISQYRINHGGPVKITLVGPKSYCNLKAIKDDKLNEILSAVGLAFEQSQRTTFLNLTHVFTPVYNNKKPENQISDIFAFVNQALNNKLSIYLIDVNKLTVNKAIDRNFLIHHQAYELKIEISEQMVETAKKSGLVFEEFLTTDPDGYRAYATGVGQDVIDSLF